MEVGKLNVTRRTAKGTSVVRKLRQAGQIPGICYGKGHDPILLTLDPLALLKALDPQKRTNTVIAMTVATDGASGKSGPSDTLNVMLRDWQRDVLRGNVTHADFVRVDLTKDVKATVPIILTGKAEGVKLGGTLHQVVRFLEIACTPDKIPVQIEVAVDALNMGEALHVSDLKLPPGLKPLLAAGQTICTVTAPKAEKVTAEVAAEAVEGAPVEGAAAAAPADGAKPAAKGDAKAAKGDAKAAAPEKKAPEKKGK
ncbi:MAG: 50S ribosomal protein L25 [Myxococcales bacterium]|nr:50S ribosomal protein L25 [Myxococcales bacterium]